MCAWSCLTLCDPMDCSLPGSSVHGNSPGKNAGVGCHALLQWIFLTQGSNPGLPHCRQILYHLSHQRSSAAAAAAAKSLQSCPTLCEPVNCSPPGSSAHRDSPGKNAGVGCHALLQWIFPSQGSNPGLLHCTRILYHLSHILSILRCTFHIFPSLTCTVLQSKAPSRSEMLPGTLLTQAVPLCGTMWGEFPSS